MTESLFTPASDGCLDAASILESSGTGLAQSELFDERGVVGRSLQSLLVDAR